VRLQLLAEAVVEQGAGLTEPQLAKEREEIVAIRDRLQQAQVNDGGILVWLWVQGEADMDHVHG
jgi:hypothetical protein